MESKKIALITMDVEAPERFKTENFALFLTLLNEFNIKATFFLTYAIVEKFPAITEQLIEKGHEIASHCYTHPTNLKEIRYNLDQKSNAEINLEIEKSRNFFNTFGFEPQGIRLPAFKWNLQILEIIARHFKYDSSLTADQLKKNFEYHENKITLPNNTLLFEIPVSTINIINIRLGTPVFFKIGAKVMTRLLKFHKPIYPFVFYSHSFDLTHIDLNKLNVRKWKKKWYYQYCSPHQIDFFRILFQYLDREGYRFLRCIDYYNLNTNGEA